MVLVNQYRAENNLPPLKANPVLHRVAGDHAAGMGGRDFFDHRDPDSGCSLPWDRMTAAGYDDWTSAGENIAAGQSTPEDVMQDWLASEGHRQNILSTSAREIGAGYFWDPADMRAVRVFSPCPNVASTRGPYYHYWVQDFGARHANGMPVLPVVINGEAPTTDDRLVSLYVYGADDGQAWATTVQFSEDGVQWSEPEPWSAHRSYALSGGAGIKTVYARIGNGAQTQVSSDTIVLLGSRVYVPLAAP